MHYVPSALQCINGCNDGVKDGDGKEEREWRLPGYLYTNDLVLYGKSKEYLRAMVGWFIEVSRRRGVKVNVGKSKVIVLNGEDGLECEVYVDRNCLI